MLHLYVIVYDTPSDTRRRQFVKLLEKEGTRINWSVFECRLSSLRLALLRQGLESVVCPKEDTVVIYPVCKACHSKAVYLPEGKRKAFRAVVSV